MSLFHLGQKGEPGLPGQPGTDGFPGPRVRNEIDYNEKIDFSILIKGLDGVNGYPGIPGRKGEPGEMIGADGIKGK